MAGPIITKFGTYNNVNRSGNGSNIKKCDSWMARRVGPLPKQVLSEPLGCVGTGTASSNPLLLKGKRL